MHCLNVNRMVLHSISIERSIRSSFFLFPWDIQSSVVEWANPDEWRKNDGRTSDWDGVELEKQEKNKRYEINYNLDMSSTISVCAPPSQSIILSDEQNDMKHEKMQEVRTTHRSKWKKLYGMLVSFLFLPEIKHFYFDWSTVRLFCIWRSSIFLPFWPGPIDRLNYTSYIFPYTHK